jgi:long-chain fatty acid transport protein
MTHRHGVRLVAAGMALGVALAASHAIAGGFAVREQSATHQGSSFAGSAAGNDLSSMFWNPAAVTNKAGINSESHGALIIGNSEINATAGNGLRFGLEPNSGNIAQSALVTTSYFNYQLSPSLYVGLSMNAPFGLTTKPDNDPYYGSLFARTSKLLTINATPTVGYKVMPGVSVAAGVQVQYIQAKLSRRGIQGEVGTVEGDDVAFGFTAGLMLEPAKGTKIGVGFRSSIAHRLAGDFNLSNNGFATADITAEADMPELVTVSLR